MRRRQNALWFGNGKFGQKRQIKRDDLADLNPGRFLAQRHHHSPASPDSVRETRIQLAT